MNTDDTRELLQEIDTYVEESAEVMRRLAGVGIDMDDVGSVLEEQAITAFEAATGVALRRMPIDRTLLAKR